MNTPGLGESSPKEGVLSPELIARFKQYVYQGGALITGGQFSEAITHFRNDGMLRKVGKRLAPARELILHALPNPEEYERLAHMIAGNSWHNDDGSVLLSKASYFPDAQKGSFREEKLPSEFLHEIALIHMEEWLHALQDIQKKPLTGVEDDEVDVAAYMRRNNIPMSQAFLSRYNRGTSLEILEKAGQLSKLSS